MSFVLTAGMFLAGVLHAAPPESVGITGVVVDRDSGDPIAGATVMLALDPSVSDVTGPDGRFVLRVKPGKHAIRAFADYHRPVRVSRIHVVDGSLVKVRVALPTDPTSEERVFVEARADKRKESVLLEARKRSGAVSDAVGAQEMGRAPDSSAGDALKRVVSTTIVDGKYVTIRGLGGRYTTTLLNGAPLPGPDPDDPAVPLDIFPAALLSNLTVAKSFSAELPGSFAGGAVQIETSTYPETFEAKIKLGLGIDTASTFQGMPTYDGGTADGFGFDDGTRALPDGIPSDGPLAIGTPGIDEAFLERAGEAFPNVWTSRRGTAWPNLSLGATIGDTVSLPSGKLGYLTSLTFSHNDRTRDSTVRKVKIEAGSATAREETDVFTGLEAASLGALASLGWQITPAHDLGFFGLYTHQGDKTAQQASGYSESDAQEMDSLRLQLVTRQLAFLQLRGRHRFASASGLELSWNSNVSFTERTEPDTRDMSWAVLPDGRRRFDAGPGAAERFFSTLNDLTAGGGINVRVPWDGVQLDVGGSVQRSGRTYSARRFRFDLVGRQPSVLFLPAEEMLGPEHIGPDFEIAEKTLASDGYEASSIVGAGYFTLDVTAGEPFRVLAGLRVEASRQVLDSGSAFAVTDDKPDGVDRLDVDYLPSAAVVWTPREDMNVRAAYGWTLARPQLREIAPLLFFDFVRRRSVSGNPGLVQTRIHNADLRWEWFPQDGAVIAASAFYKHFDDPIERVVVSAAAGDVSFANAASAWVVGGELEAKSTLGFLHRALADVRLSANLTVIHSSVDFAPGQATVQTSSSRPLQGLSPYVVNVGLGFEPAGLGLELGLFYNVTGPRIAEVGFDGLPDVYEQPLHRLDLSASQQLPAGWKLKLAASNLAFQSARFEADSVVVLETKPSVSISLSIEWAWQPSVPSGDEEVP